MRPGIHTILVIILNLCATAGAGEKVYVYCITTGKPLVLQHELQQRCPDCEFTVFRRHIDFEERLSIDSPAVIITLPRLIKQIPGYTIQLRGTRKGKNAETYVLVSDKTQITPADIGSQSVIGVIDFLGRAGMKAFISGLFATAPMPQRVSQIEDLLPLITYNMAQAVLLLERDVPYIQQKTKMNLVITPLPAAHEEIIAIAAKDAAKAASLLTCIRRLDGDTNAFLGVDAWK
jgi:hypothetical protein